MNEMSGNNVPAWARLGPTGQLLRSRQLPWVAGWELLLALCYWQMQKRHCATVQAAPDLIQEVHQIDRKQPS